MIFSVMVSVVCGVIVLLQVCGVVWCGVVLESYSQARSLSLPLSSRSLSAQLTAVAVARAVPEWAGVAILTGSEAAGGIY